MERIYEDLPPKSESRSRRGMPVKQEEENAEAYGHVKCWEVWDAVLYGNEKNTETRYPTEERKKGFLWVSGWERRHALTRARLLSRGWIDHGECGVEFRLENGRRIKIPADELRPCKPTRGKPHEK